MDWFFNKSIVINVATNTVAADGTSSITTVASTAVLASLQELNSSERIQYQREFSSTLAKIYIPPTYSDGTSISLYHNMTITFDSQTWLIIGTPVRDVNNGNFYKCIIELQV